MARWRLRAGPLAREAAEQPGGSILDEYVRSAPSDQHAIDIFAGEWSSSFPASTGLIAGTVPLFEDPRITWVLDQLGDAHDLRVLELGPLEGAHSAMLHQAGASVVAVEANTRAYLKCLVVKEILGLHRCRFLLGDFGAHLRTTAERYDLVLASGVLYHATDPIGLLEAIAGVADRVAIWTHYYHDEVVRSDPDKARRFVAPEVVTWRGERITLHRRNYLESLEWRGFCGGPEASAVWMERDGIVRVLEVLGLGRITVQSDDLANPNGACVMLLATR